jgi:alpha-glucosidase
MTLVELRRFTELASTPEQKQLALQYWRDMFMHQLDGPGLHQLMKELRQIVDEYEGDRLLVAEDENISYMGHGADELHLVFNFPLMRTPRLTPEHIRQNQELRLAELEALPAGGWPCNTLNNHDTPRVYTAFGDKVHNADLARLNAALVLTLKGTPFLYNGEEIGMSDLLITDPSRLRDTMATWYYAALIQDLGMDPSQAALSAAAMTRDRNRTPMQWSSGPNAGFSPGEAKTWLPVNPNYAEGINVLDQADNPASLLNYYRRLISVRKSTPALMTGDYRPLAPASNDYFAFLRSAPDQTVLVALNYSERRQSLEPGVPEFQHARVLFTSAARAPRVESLDGLALGPFEVLIAELLE